MTLFRGLSAFSLTPTDAAGRVETDALCGLLGHLAAAGVDSIGLLGSTGAYAYLSRPERRRAVKAAVECVEGQTPLVVGVGALRTDEAQALARDGNGLGSLVHVTAGAVHSGSRRPCTEVFLQPPMSA